MNVPGKGVQCRERLWVCLLVIMSKRELFAIFLPGYYRDLVEDDPW